MVKKVVCEEKGGVRKKGWCAEEKKSCEKRRCGRMKVWTRKRWRGEKTGGSGKVGGEGERERWGKKPKNGVKRREKKWIKK